MEPTMILISKRDPLKFRMTVFADGVDGDGNESNITLFAKSFDQFGTVANAVHDLAWDAVRGKHGLKLQPCYPPGDGYFIVRGD